MHRFSWFSESRERLARSLPSHNVVWIRFIVLHYSPDLNRKPISSELGAWLRHQVSSKNHFGIESRGDRRAKDRRKRKRRRLKKPLLSEPAYSWKAAAYRAHLATRLFEISHELDAQRTHCDAWDSDIARRVSYRRRRHRRRRCSRHSRARYLFREK